MKNLIILAFLIFASINADAANQEIYKLSVEVTDLIYSHQDEFTTQEKEQIANHFYAIRSIVDGRSDANCDTQQNVYKLAFQWARSASGLSAAKSEAMEFAREISAKYCPNLFLDSYKESFAWARSTNGLSAYKSKAMEFASLMSEFNAATHFTKSVLECIRPEYEFARSNQGLSLPRDEAEAFAKKQCGVTES